MKILIQLPFYGLQIQETADKRISFNDIFVCHIPSDENSLIDKGKHNTFEDAKFQRRKQILQLEKSQSCRITSAEKARLPSIIDALKACSKGNRCGKLFCHVCMLIRCNRVVGAALNYFRSGETYFITIAPKRWRIQSRFCTQ